MSIVRTIHAMIGGMHLAERVGDAKPLPKSLRNKRFF